MGPSWVCVWGNGYLNVFFIISFPCSQEVLTLPPLPSILYACIQGTQKHMVDHTLKNHTYFPLCLGDFTLS